MSQAIDDCWNRIGVRGDRSCPELVEHIHCRNCPAYGAAAASLLDRELPGGYVEQWSAHFAAPVAPPAQDEIAAFIFRVGPEWLALVPSAVAEVADERPIHTLPHRRDKVLGLANVRGELLACLSLAGLLGLQPVARSPTQGRRNVYPRLLVLQGEGGRLAFPVDEAHGIERFAPGAAQQLPATLSRSQAIYTRAILPWRDRTVGRLDEQLLYYALSRSLL